MSSNNSAMPALQGVWPQVVSFLDLRSVTKLWLSGSSAMRHWLAQEVANMMPSVVYLSSRRRKPSWPLVVTEMTSLRELNLTLNPWYKTMSPPLALLPQAMASLTNLTVPRLAEGLNLHEKSPYLTSLSVTHAMRTDADWPRKLPQNLQNLEISLITPCITCWCVRLPASLSRLHILLVRQHPQDASPPLDTRILPPFLTDLSITDRIETEQSDTFAESEQWPNDSAMDTLQPWTRPHPTPPHPSSSSSHGISDHIDNSKASSAFHFHDNVYSARVTALSNDPRSEFVRLTTHHFASLEPFPLYPPLQSHLSNLTSLDLGFTLILYVQAHRNTAHRRNPEFVLDPLGPRPDTPYSGLPTHASASTSASECSSSSHDIGIYNTPSTRSVASSVSLSGRSLALPLPSRRRSHSSSAHSTSIGSRSSYSHCSISASAPGGVPLFRTSPSSNPATPTLASTTMPHTPLSGSPSVARRPRSSSSGPMKTSISSFGSFASSVRSSSSSHSASLGKCAQSSPRSDHILDVPTNLSGGWVQLAAYSRLKSYSPFTGLETTSVDEEEDEAASMEGSDLMHIDELSDSAPTAFTTFPDWPPREPAAREPLLRFYNAATLERESGPVRFEVGNLPKSLTELRGKMSTIKPNAYRELESTLRVLKVLPYRREPLRDDDVLALPRCLEALNLHSINASQVALLPSSLTEISSSLEFDEDFRVEEFMEALPRSLLHWKASEGSDNEALFLPPLKPTRTEYLDVATEESTSFHWHQSRSGSLSMAPPTSSKKLASTPQFLHSSSHSSFSFSSRTETQESSVLSDDHDFDPGPDRRRRRRSSTSFASSSPKPDDPKESPKKPIPTFPQSLTELDCNVNDLETLAYLPRQARKLSLTFSPKLLESYQMRQRPQPVVFNLFGRPTLRPKPDVKSPPLSVHLPRTLESLTLDFKEAEMLNALLLPEGFSVPEDSMSADAITPSSAAAAAPFDRLTSLSITSEEEIRDQYAAFLRYCLPGQLTDLILQFGPPKKPPPLKSTGSGASLFSSGSFFSRSSSPAPQPLIELEKKVVETPLAQWPFGKGLPRELQSLAVIVASKTSFENGYRIKVTRDEIDALPESLVYLLMPLPAESEHAEIDSKLQQLENNGLEYHFNS